MNAIEECADSPSRSATAPSLPPTASPPPPSEREAKRKPHKPPSATKSRLEGGVNEVDGGSFKNFIGECEKIYSQTVVCDDFEYKEKDKKFDKILTSKFSGILIMIAGLFGILWLTLEGTNIISDYLSIPLFGFIEPLSSFFDFIQVPVWVKGLIVDGMYKTLAWVVSVMLPPMSLFFPMFTLIEDLGYLPRVAFNLDNFFRKSGAHGKQALTACMACLNL